MEKESKRGGLKKKDDMNAARTRVEVGEIAAKEGLHLATPIYQDKPRLKLD